jgi:hypothetical protein
VQRAAVEEPVACPKTRGARPCLRALARSVGEPDGLDLCADVDPREDDSRTLDQAIGGRCKRCGRTRAVFGRREGLAQRQGQEWWATSESADHMMFHFLGGGPRQRATDQPEHREVVRILVLCVRTTPNLTDEDHQALDLLEAWTAGGEDRRKKAETLASSKAVMDTCSLLLKGFSSNPWNAIFEVLERR